MGSMLCMSLYQKKGQSDTMVGLSRVCKLIRVKNMSDYIRSRVLLLKVNSLFVTNK